MRVWWSLATISVFLAAGCAPPAADTGASTVASVPASSILTTSADPSPPATTSTAAPTTVTTKPTTTTTTTVPGPPRLEVLDPIHGATVTTRRYTFSGVTDPDCAVTVGGKYRATVEPDGSWTLDLMLGPGRNSTTFVATHPETGFETSQAIRVYYADLDGLVLQGDGLGVVSFGDPMDDVIATLTERLGPPTGDRIEQSPFGVAEGDSGPAACNTVTGYLCYDYIRWASWSHIGLWITIADVNGDGWGEKGAPNLRGYTYGAGDAGAVLHTLHGITVGTTVDELQALGDLVTFGVDGCGEVIRFTASDAGGSVTGWISGAEDGSDVEAFMESGYLDPNVTVRDVGAGQESSC